MPKLKTRKSIAKRVNIKKKKILIKKGGQGHFNARESGKVKRNKRRPKELTKNKTAKTIRQNVPYS